MLRAGEKTNDKQCRRKKLFAPLLNGTGRRGRSEAADGRPFRVEIEDRGQMGTPLTRTAVLGLPWDPLKYHASCQRQSALSPATSLPPLITLH